MVLFQIPGKHSYIGNVVFILSLPHLLDHLVDPEALGTFIDLVTGISQG